MSPIAERSAAVPHPYRRDDPPLRHAPKANAPRRTAAPIGSPRARAATRPLALARHRIHNWSRASRGTRTCPPMRSPATSACCSSTRWACRARSRSSRAERETAIVSCSLARAGRGEPGRASRRAGVPPAAGTARSSSWTRTASTAEQAATGLPTSSGCSVRTRARRARTRPRPAATRRRRLPPAQDERHRALDREPACGDLRRPARRLRPRARDQRALAPPRGDALGDCRRAASAARAPRSSTSSRPMAGRPTAPPSSAPSP